MGSPVWRSSTANIVSLGSGSSRNRRLMQCFLGWWKLTLWQSCHVFWGGENSRFSRVMLYVLGDRSSRYWKAALWLNNIYWSLLIPCLITFLIKINYFVICFKCFVFLNNSLGLYSVRIYYTNLFRLIGPCKLNARLWSHPLLVFNFINKKKQAKQTM